MPGFSIGLFFGFLGLWISPARIIVYGQQMCYYITRLLVVIAITNKNKKMINLKRKRFFASGRKWIFTLALFVLVFAAASIVKVKAGTENNASGWLWGGGTESDGSAPYDGTNSNVRWISMNSVNTSSPVDYGVNIPGSDGPVTGYAWSGGDDSGPGLGWIDFNPQDHCTTGAPGAGQYKALSCALPAGSSGSPGVSRSGDKLVGWARIVGIAQESANNNSGGWSGWVHMNGNYGVDLAKMVGDTGPKPLAEMTFATAGGDELGWIDFSGAKYTPVCSVASVTPTPPVYLKEPANKCQPVTVTLKDVSESKTINFAVDPAGVVKLSKNSDCSSPSDGFSLAIPDNNPHKVYVSANNFSSDATADVEISGDCGSSTEEVRVIKTPACTLNCPSEITLSTSETKSVKSEISASGDSECASLVTCSESGTDSEGNIDVSSSCDVSETGNLRYGSSELKATAGSGSCTSPISIKGLGWIETNP